MRKLISGGIIANEGRCFEGSVVIANDRIEQISEGTSTPRGTYDETIDATGCFVFPGVIDEHVHFREPGLTAKADIESESRAAAWGGVTTFFDMPNTVPQTVTLEALADKFSRARQESYVNYSFFFGATNNNAHLFARLDKHRIPGIKLFMGASTGNMLVDRMESLGEIFAETARLGLPLMTHCEDTQLINRNMQEAKARYGADPDVRLHPAIRSAEACYASSALAAKLARQYGTRLHIAHISTAKELELIEPLCTPLRPQVTGEAVLAHLLFTDADYATKGALIKCNPAVKTAADRDALRKALASGLIATVGTDHAPHEPDKKQGGCAKAASGMPMLQYSLVSMLGLADEGILPIERIPELMAHNPALLFSVRERGFLRPGYKADVAIVRRHCPWTLTQSDIQSKCRWSPLLGTTFDWRVQRTICNGVTVYNNGILNKEYRGEEVSFR